MPSFTKLFEICNDFFDLVLSGSFDQYSYAILLTG